MHRAARFHRPRPKLQKETTTKPEAPFETLEGRLSWLVRVSAQWWWKLLTPTASAVAVAVAVVGTFLPSVLRPCVCGSTGSQPDTRFTHREYVMKPYTYI